MSIFIFTEIMTFFIGSALLFTAFSLTRDKANSLDSAIRKVLDRHVKLSFAEIASRDASIFLTAIENVYGSKIWSFRAYTFALISTAIVFLALAILASSPMDFIRFNLDNDEAWLVVLLAHPLNTLIDLISLSLTVYFVKRIANSINSREIGMFLLADFAVAYFLISLPIIVIALPQGELEAHELVMVLLTTPIQMLGMEGSQFGEMDRGQFGFMFALLISPIFPTLIHAIYLIWALLLRWILPIYQNVLKFAKISNARHKIRYLSLLGTFILFLSQALGVLQKLV